METIFMESRAKAKEIASEEFPFIFYVVGNEEAFDRPVFPTYRARSTGATIPSGSGPLPPGSLSRIRWAVLWSPPC